MHTSKKIAGILILFFSLVAVADAKAQYKIIPTDTLRISGRVKKELVLLLSDLASFKKTGIGDVTISDKNGNGKIIKNVKGILVKDLFAKIEFESETWKSLNSFYLIFSAMDGFKLVLSWNELFHTETCNNYYLITDEDGKPLDKLGKRILIMQINDLKAGHNRIEGLERIRVVQAE